jgi:hypothetical protein
MRLLGASVLLLAACGDDALPPPAGPHTRYVVSELHIPNNNKEAIAVAVDLDHDGAADNQLGQVFGVLAENGLSVSSSVREALLRGGLIMLADLQATVFDVGVAGFTTYLGADPSPAPCSDPARIETCGRHLTGTGRFTVKEASASTTAAGMIDNGTFSADTETLPVQLVIDDQSPPIRLDLQHAHVELAAISEKHVSAVIAGAITQGDIATVVIPQAQAQIDRIVQNECGQQDAPPPCGCVQGSRSALLEGVFDTNPRDCHVTVEEIAHSTLAQALLATDVRFGNERLMSFSVGVELVSARFDP